MKTFAYLALIGAVSAIGDDWNSDIGTYSRQKTRNYATPYTTHTGQPALNAFWDENHIMAGSFGTVPRDEGKQIMRNSLAQDDWNSDIGTYSGQKTRNYATPYRTHNGAPNLDAFRNENHIMPGSMITTPRDDGPQVMRNSAMLAHRQSLNQMRDLPSNEVANGDKSDDKELEKENDPNDAIVDMNGHTNAGYGSAVPKTFFDRNHIMPGTMITVPRDERNPGLGNSLSQNRQSLGYLRQQNLIGLNELPSNEVANGDKSDDKELEMENDPNDFVVDYNGQTNAGYGSTLPTDYFQKNRMLAGSFGTVPRDDGPQPVRNSLLMEDSLINLRVTPTNSFVQMSELPSNEVANGDRSDDKELEMENDPNDFVVDFNGQTNAGYGSTLPTSYFQKNHMLAGSFGTVPRDDGPQPVRNS